MKKIRADRVERGIHRGSSLPLVVTTADGAWIVKMRGSGQGTAPLVAEIIVVGLAETIGLPVPERSIVTIDSSVGSNDDDPEVLELIAASYGENLGFRWIEGSHDLRSDQLYRIDPTTAGKILWLDRLTMNSDRSLKNPNILLRGKEIWLIDHGAALPFHYAWGRISEESPRSQTDEGLPHLLIDHHPEMVRLDTELANRLTRERLQQIVADVPSSFLRPLLPDPLPPIPSTDPALRLRPDATVMGGEERTERSDQRDDPERDTGEEQVERRREAYVAFLWKRLKEPRSFLGRPAEEEPEKKSTRPSFLNAFLSRSTPSDSEREEE